ncbi:MAG: CPBP family intramembrane metalloprotease [Thermococcus sp.]|uniref:CPBP family archaeomyxosortase MrtA n=1 Tax=Thermococcus sp. TaxID=35749 RepID=UPI001DFCAAD9|nr:CPBP family archaeomyxosortase MrtA [Thermococcus sp.]MBO8174611.1 CPBP family intramembrane metalloprotease [Thermococcus sp.]
MKTFLLYLISLIFIILNWHLGQNIYEWTLYDISFYVFLPLIVAYLLGFKPNELGFKVGKREGYIWAFALFLATLPLSIYASKMESFRSFYPIFSYSSWGDFIFKELLVGAIMFAHEAFYRGILLFPLAEKNEWLGILAQNIPYTLVHIGKPSLEVPYSFIAGIIFAKMDLKSESFLPSFFLHWIGSAVFDVLCVI